MGQIFEPLPIEMAEWDEWLDERPPDVAAVARRFPPWELFQIKGGHRCTMHSIGELVGGGVSLTVLVTDQFNDDVVFPRTVFGINPDDLTPCDIPAMSTP